MTDSQKAEAPVPTFNVVVTMPKSQTLEEMERLGIEVVGMDPKKVAGLAQAFRSGPQVMVGKGVTRERVDAVKEDLARMGLQVTVSPVLALQEHLEDTRYKCPACEAMVDLPESRQCPACGVFVDKVTSDFLLRKKIREQERGKVALLVSKRAAGRELDNRRSLEESIRRQIRHELEEKMGLKKAGGPFAGQARWIRGAALFLLIGAAFVGGNAASGLRNSEPPAREGSTKGVVSEAQSFEQMLDAAADRSGASAVDDGPENASGVPEASDSLVAVASEIRSGGQALSVEQAVAAANVLSGSKGGATTHSLQGKSGATVPVLAKVALTSEFAVTLGEIGHTARANEVFRVLMGNPALASEPQAAAIAQSASLELQALSIAGGQATQTRSQLDALRLNAEKITPASERSVALARCGLILGRNPLLPKQASAAFMALATDAAKLVTHATQRRETEGQVMLARAELALFDIADLARKGMWAKAQASATVVDAMASQSASTQSAPQLMAIAAQAQHGLGQYERAQQLLELALEEVERESSVLRRAVSLRAVARWTQGFGGAKVMAASQRVANTAEKVSQTEMAGALVQLALIDADAGQSDQFNQTSKRATAMTGLTPVESGAVYAQIIVGAELAAARLHYCAQSWRETDERLKKVAALLL
jgi:hypothetical protein